MVRTMEYHVFTHFKITICTVRHQEKIIRPKRSEVDVLTYCTKLCRAARCDRWGHEAFQHHLEDSFSNE